jgi:hypothetical protein
MMKGYRIYIFIDTLLNQDQITDLCPIMVELVKVTSSDIIALQALSRQTFYETFAEENTPANMQSFLDRAFQEEGLLKEINNPHSVFYFAKTGDNIIGYLKVNTGPA